MASSITDTYGNRPYVCFRKGGNRLIEKEKSSNQIPSFPHRLYVPISLIEGLKAHICI